jgi:hypothetical protein
MLLKYTPLFTTPVLEGDRTRVQVLFFELIMKWNHNVPLTRFWEGVA